MNLPNRSDWTAYRIVWLEADVMLVSDMACDTKEAYESRDHGNAKMLRTAYVPCWITIDSVRKWIVFDWFTPWLYN